VTSFERSERQVADLVDDNRFRLLVSQVTDYAIFLLAPTGHVRTWNAGAERIKGYRPEEIVGEHFSKFYPSQDRWKCEIELEGARATGRFEDEGWRVRKDGSRFWANVVITCIRNPDGEIAGFGKVTRDLTERRRAEEFLKASEERFRLLVENVKDYALFMLDPRGTVVTWNSGAERIKGYTANEIIGEHFSRFYPGGDERAAKCQMELDTATHVGRFEDEGIRVRKDGSRFWANVIITALRDETGKLVGFAKVTRDLTERKAAEEQRLRLGELARERIRALSELAENLAATLSVEEVGRAVTEKGKALVHADICSLSVFDEDHRTLRLVADFGFDAALRERFRVLTRESGGRLYDIGSGASDGVWIDDVEQHADDDLSLPISEGEGSKVRTVAWLSLPVEGGSMGLLGVGYREAHVFSEEERQFISTVARQAAQSLARARRIMTERLSSAIAERLRASLATTLQSIGDAVIATDALGTVAMMNRVAETLTGWSEAEARGKPLLEVFHIVNEQTRALVPSPVEKVLETGGIVGLANHTVLIARDGREVPIDDSGAPIRGEDGVIQGVVLVFRDVSERKLEESRRTFLAEATSILSQSLDYEITVERVAHLAVPRLADWCAVDIVVEGEARPKRLAVAHIDPEKIELAKELDAKYPPRADAPNGVPNVLRSGRSELYSNIPDELLVEACVDEEHLRLARALRLRSAMVVPLVWKGRVLGAMSFVFAESGRTYTNADLELAEELARRCANAIENSRLFTSEQRARHSADTANRAKDEFLAVVSHELRTPLNAIMGWAQLLTQPDFDDRRRRRALETIERNALAMAQLIEDLLDMSRVISGKLRLNVEKVELARVVEAAVDTARPAANAKGIEIVTNFDFPIPFLMGDATRLQQVVWNLLSNAVKFTSKGGRVDVVLRAPDSAVEVAVSDTGSGIAPAFLPFVFEAFRQEDAGATRLRGGLGLGLAITQELVELHGGSVTAASAGTGQGATFTVRLPIAAVVSAAPAATSAGRQFPSENKFERPAHLRGLRVLVVDDEDDARLLVRAVLEDCGCEVTTAATVAEGLDRIREDRPDVLLSDIGMPGEDGYELIRKVRLLPAQSGGDVPAAALTAYARPEDRRRLLNAGYSIHLPKPVEPAELVAVVATLSRFVQRGGQARGA
jgi:PAS domain S-box-containing protein